MNFNIFKSKKSSKLTKRLNRAKYNIVDGFGKSVMESTSRETQTEDEILSPDKRAKLLNATRNLVRNSSLFQTILGQLTTQTISSCGGKVILNFQNQELNKNLKRYFADFTRNADFFDGITYNHLLKTILKEIVIGGDCVLLFDDGLIENSGRVLIFESDEIVNVAPEVIEKYYGKSAYQSQGKVYNKNGRHIGTVVSKSQRGVDIADPSKCFFLKKDPNQNPLLNNWLQPSNAFRSGRAVSQAASAISTIHQLEDLVTSELMAARRNSQVFCWLTQKQNEEPETIPSGFDDPESMSDEEVEEAAKTEASTTQTISFNKARENSVVYEALPENYQAQQLDTKHPNESVEAIVSWLAGRAAATLGLSKVYVTGSPDDGNFRSNQLLTQAAIVEFQKNLEQICDWTFYQVAKFNGVDLNMDDMSKVAWEWKQIDTLDPVANETANEMKLRNGTSNYKEILGNDWREKLLETANEIKWLKENNLPTIAFFGMKSGGESTGSDQETETITKI